MFNRFNFKAKLIFGFGILIIFIILLSTISYNYIQKMVSISDLSMKMSTIDKQILEMRSSAHQFLEYSRNSIAFIRNGESKYFDAHKKLYHLVNIKLKKLKKSKLVLHLNLQEEFNFVLSNLATYEDSFIQTSKLIKEEGYGIYGIRGVLNKSNLVLAKQTQNIDIYIWHKINILEKKYIYTHKKKYETELLQAIKELKLKLNTSNKKQVIKKATLNYINNYKNSFDELVDVLKWIGINNDSGALGAMNLAFNNSQPIFINIKNKIYSQLQSINYSSHLIVIVLTVIATLLGFIISLVIAKEITQPLKLLKESAEKVAIGDLDLRISINSNDEIGLLSKAFIQVIESGKDLEKAARKIGSGDFDIKIVPRSNKDVLTISLIKMRDNLKLSHYQAQKKIWVNTQISNIINISQGIQSLSELSTLVINKLSKVIDAQYGAFYITSKNLVNNVEDDNSLILSGSYALLTNTKTKKIIFIGEGLTGQCALDKKEILTSNIDFDHIQVDSGLGCSSPKFLINYPILFEDEIVGVIELATLKIIDEHKLQILNLVCQSLGIIINNISNNIKTKLLLEKSQEMSKELQSQKKDLKKANFSLETKTNLLENSEKSLTQLNSKLEKHAEKLESQQLELEQKAKALESSSKYKSEFIANVSHELRTPLHSMLILSKKLYQNKDNNLNEKQLQAAQIINAGGNELLYLINDILDLSKVEAGKMQVELRKTNVIELTKQLHKYYAPMTEEKGLKFLIDIENNIPTSIITDQQRLSQILRNFISNAIKFTSKGSISIKLELSQDNQIINDNIYQRQELIKWHVIDTGIGIDEKNKSIIFESFQQAEGSTNRKYGGTGLGLAIATSMSEVLGGKIELDSIYGKGSTFSLVLPLTTVKLKNKNNIIYNEIDEHVEDINNLIIKEKTNQTPSVRYKELKNINVLLIDSDLRNVYSLSGELSKYKVNVIPAINKVEVIKKLQTNIKFNFVLLYFDTSNTDLESILQELNKKKSCPIIAISSKDNFAKLSKEIISGFHMFLYKPTTAEHILSKINILNKKVDSDE